MSGSRSVAIVAIVWLTVAATSMPVRRSPDLEARRRSAIDRSMIRLGRSSPADPSAADLREVFERPTRRGNSFLRFGRSQPLTLSSDDLISLITAYQDENVPQKKSASFVRFGRDPAFIRFGRSADNDKLGNEQTSELLVSGYPQRKHRARDHHFIRLGRNSVNDVDSDSENIYQEDIEVPHKNSASFVQFGRNNNLSGGVDEDFDGRTKATTESCHDC